MTTRSPRRRVSLGGSAALSLAVAAVVCGCGKSAPSPAASTHSSDARAAGARGAGVPASAVSVIKGWADALRAGRPRQAAAYWAHPSVMVNGTDSAGRLAVIRIDSEHDALLADATLSCGATLRSTTRSGALVRAEFTLSIRTGAGASSSGCSGPAGVDFLIRAGHIVHWLRAPVSSGAPEAGKAPSAGETPGAQSS